MCTLLAYYVMFFSLSVAFDSRLTLFLIIKNLSTG
nr:MAG TPA: hypothetical protein [Herelleviridae sp.]